MKKTYKTPIIRTVNIEAEGLVAQSGGGKIGFGAGAATHSSNPEEDVLSNRRGGSMWDEE